MIEKTLMELDKFCVNATHWEGDDYKPMLELEWVEQSNYCMYPDSECSIEITEAKAIELIAVLSEHFKL